MDGCLAMLFDGLASQVQGESVHLAFLAVVGGIGVVSSVFTWLLRRDLKRRDDDQKALAGGILEVGKKFDALKDKHGAEISDTRIAIAPLFQQAGLQQPNYPSR